LWCRNTNSSYDHVLYVMDDGLWRHWKKHPRRNYGAQLP
jgi:hypothetical protein